MSDITTGSDSILRVRAVLACLSISRATLYRGIRAGHFPAPVRVGARAVGWRSSDIQSVVRTGIQVC